jgi:hypothetical protein
MPALDEPQKVEVKVSDLPGVKKALAKGAAKAAAMKAGRLWRVKHLAYGSRVVEAKDAVDAAGVFAQQFNPGMAQNKEWVARFAQECRIAKLAPPKAEGKAAESPEPA